MASKQYPLWCVDRRNGCEDAQYSLHDTREEAEEECADAKATGDSKAVVCRARRLPASLVAPGLADVVEYMNEEPEAFALDRTFACWDEPLVRLKPGADEAWAKFVDEWLELGVWQTEEAPSE